ARIVSTPGIGVGGAIESTPHEHDRAGPQRRMVGAARGGVRRGGELPAVSKRIVAAPRLVIGDRGIAGSAPNDHLISRPDGRVLGAGRRSTRYRGRHPCVKGRVVSGAGL